MHAYCIPWAVDYKQLFREATELISWRVEAAVRSWSGQVISQKINVELVIIAEVIVEIELGRGIASERNF